MASTSDLTRAFDALANKQARQAALWGYYDGNQPLAYATKRLRDIFKGLDTHFAENWCAVVVDSLKDRVNLTGLALDALWDNSELNLGSDDVHEAALIVGEAYLIIWPDAEGVPQAHFNDPRLCHVQYDAENPRIAAWAAKWWEDEDGKRRMTLYYPDHLEYYVSQKKAGEVQSAKGMGPAEDPEAVNPYGQIPVFHFRPQRRVVKGELVNVLPLQDAINKLLSDMMVQAEFGAAPQRYIISNMDENGPPLKNAPNEIWNLPAGDGEGQSTSVGQFSATDLDNYLGAIDNLAGAIGTITRTPRHYLFGDAGAVPSGEALIALEAPLNKKAQDRIDAFVPTWQRAAAFALKVLGQTVAPSEIAPLFDKPESIQPRTAAEITQIRVGSGLPLTSALRMEGLSEAELAQVEMERAQEAERQQLSLGQALLASQERFDRGGMAGE